MRVHVIIAFLAVVLALHSATQVRADLPIHCLNNQVAGEWEFTLSADDHDHPTLCGYRAPDRSAFHLDGSYKYELTPVKTVTVTLNEPNIIVSKEGNGTWTMVYDEGFHVHLGEQQFFAFHRYQPKKGTPLDDIHARDYVSYCSETLIGWFHGAQNKKWGCWRGKQVKPANSFVKPAASTDSVYTPTQYAAPVVSPVNRGSSAFLDQLFEPNYALIEEINNDEDALWKAKVHEPFLSKTVREMLRLSGAKQFNTPQRRFNNHEKAAAPASFAEEDAHLNKVIKEMKEQTHAEEICEFGLPCSFDWRRKKGKGGKITNYLSSIRNQGSCGSCYTMAFMAALESRVRIAREDVSEQRFSPQLILACSVYNQGCDGGYPFLVGKHTEEFGAVREDCFLYQGRDSQCHHKCNDKLEYPITNTRYVGGYYGACNEELMMRDLIENGPMVLAFEAPPALFSYHKGIFHGPKPKAEEQNVKGLNKWEHTNHAVVAVGWGSEIINAQRVKYWIIRNTWGRHWGENGYFRIVRGTDECGIESMAVTFDTIKRKWKGDESFIHFSFLVSYTKTRKEQKKRIESVKNKHTLAWLKQSVLLFFD